MRSFTERTLLAKKAGFRGWGWFQGGDWRGDANSKPEVIAGLLK